jgi:hypothetical protein
MKRIKSTKRLSDVTVGLVIGWIISLVFPSEILSVAIILAWLVLIVLAKWFW